MARYHARCFVQLKVSNFDHNVVSPCHSVDRELTTRSSNPLVTLDFPQPLQQRVINALKADPKTVDVRAQAPHFYALGSKILELFEDEDVVDVLLDASRIFSMFLGCDRPPFICYQ